MYVLKTTWLNKYIFNPKSYGGKALWEALDALFTGGMAVIGAAEKPTII